MGVRHSIANRYDLVNNATLSDKVKLILTEFTVTTFLKVEVCGQVASLYVGSPSWSSFSRLSSKSSSLDSVVSSNGPQPPPLSSL